MILLLPEVMTAVSPVMGPVVVVLFMLVVVVVWTEVPATRVLLKGSEKVFILVLFRDFCLRPGSPGHLSCRIIFSLYM